MSQEFQGPEEPGHPGTEGNTYTDGPAEQPLRRVERDGVEYTLLGTAHVSRASAEAVKRMAGSGDFDRIAV